MTWLARGAIAGTLMLISTSASRQETDKERAALAGALRGKHVSLSKALTTAKVYGKPISAKYEYEDGKLQLSVYTTKDQKFFEVVVDHLSGSVVKSERISEADDFKAAEGQSAALRTAHAPLDTAVRQALREHPGSVAVGAMPALERGQCIVTVTLLKRTRFTTVAERLD